MATKWAYKAAADMYYDGVNRWGRKPYEEQW